MSEEHDSEATMKPDESEVQDQPNFPGEPSGSSSLYQTAVERMRAGDYEAAVGLFEQNSEQRGETTPDILRDLGWCYYRIGEELMFRSKNKEGIAQLAQGRECYRQAEEGFLELRKTRHAPELLTRIDQHLADCQRRLTLIDGLGEHLQHKVEFVHKEKEREAENTKIAKQGILAQDPEKLEVSGEFDAAGNPLSVEGGLDLGTEFNLKSGIRKSARSCGFLATE